LVLLQTMHPLFVIQNSWHGRIEVIGFESYDFRLAFQAISEGSVLNQICWQYVAPVYPLMSRITTLIN
jgi:hypothetical protein